MPFVLDVSEGGPFEIRLLRNKFEIIGIAPLGHDDVRDISYSVQVSLMQCPPFDGSIERTELLFSLVESDGDTTKYFDDGRATTSFLVGQNRRVALDIIRLAARQLLEERSPDVVTMSTVQKNPPEKALAKYRTVAAAVQAAGYVGGLGDAYDGYRIWMFVKK